MGRPDKAPSETLAPADWPSWVLSFGGGFCPDDPVRRAAQRIEFRTWQRLRTDWFEKQGLPVNVRVCTEERRRRALAAQGSSGSRSWVTVGY
jgi:hypothetical protein